MDVPRGGFLRGGRNAERTGRTRRFLRSLIQQGRRRVGRGGVQDERARDVVAEGARAIFGRRRRG